MTALVRVVPIGDRYGLLRVRDGEVLETYEDRLEADNAARLVNDGEWRKGAEERAA